MRRPPHFTSHLQVEAKEVFGRNQTVVNVIKVTTAVAYGRKLCPPCYKTFLRPYFTLTEPSGGVNMHVKLRHRHWRN